MTALIERHAARLRAHEAGEHEAEINSRCPACSLVMQADGQLRRLEAKTRGELWEAHSWGCHANTAVPKCLICGNVLHIALAGLSKALYPPASRRAIPRGFTR
jgi:hypothetical protein